MLVVVLLRRCFLLVLFRSHNVQEEELLKTQIYVAFRLFESIIILCMALANPKALIRPKPLALPWSLFVCGCRWPNQVSSSAFWLILFTKGPTTLPQALIRPKPLALPGSLFVCGCRWPNQVSSSAFWLILFTKGPTTLPQALIRPKPLALPGSLFVCGCRWPNQVSSSAFWLILFTKGPTTLPQALIRPKPLALPGGTATGRTGYCNDGSR